MHSATSENRGEAGRKGKTASMTQPWQPKPPGRTFRCPRQKSRHEQEGEKRQQTKQTQKERGGGSPSSKLLSSWALLSASLVLLDVRSVLNFKSSAYLGCRGGEGVGEGIPTDDPWLQAGTAVSASNPTCPLPGSVDTTVGPPLGLVTQDSGPARAPAAGGTA